RLLSLGAGGLCAGLPPAAAGEIQLPVAADSGTAGPVGPSVPLCLLHLPSAGAGAVAGPGDAWVRNPGGMSMGRARSLGGRARFVHGDLTAPPLTGPCCRSIIHPETTAGEVAGWRTGRE